MILEALEWLAEQVQPQTYNVHGKGYSSVKLESLPSPDVLPQTVVLHTLDWFARFVDESLDGEHRNKWSVHVSSPTSVSLLGPVFGDFNQREEPARCEAITTKSFGFGRYVDPEEFICGLQSKFVQDETTAILLKIVGSMTAEAVRSVDDDGVSQTVSARVGVARVSNVKVPNPVVLRPYRTFAEIEQPASRYVLRMRRSGDGLPEAMLLEVEDSLWQFEAVNAIREYLDERLSDICIYA